MRITTIFIGLLLILGMACSSEEKTTQSKEDLASKPTPGKQETSPTPSTQTAPGKQGSTNETSATPGKKGNQRTTQYQVPSGFITKPNKHVKDYFLALPPSLFQCEKKTPPAIIYKNLEKGYMRIAETAVGSLRPAKDEPKAVMAVFKDEKNKRDVIAIVRSCQEACDVYRFMTVNADGYWEDITEDVFPRADAEKKAADNGATGMIGFEIEEEGTDILIYACGDQKKSYGKLIWKDGVFVYKK